MVRFTAGVFLTALCVSVFASGASAQDARVLFQRGQEAAASGEWEDALRHYEEARELANRASVVFNIAYSLKNLERHLEAFDVIEEYADTPDANTRPELAAQAARLREEVLEELAQLRVAVTPATATVLLDSETINVSETHVLDPGPHRLHLSAPNHEPRDVPLDLVSGESTSHVIELRPIVVSEEVLPPPPVDPELVDTDAERGGWWRSPVLWTVVGIVVVGGAVGLGVGLRARCVADDCNPDWM